MPNRQSHASFIYPLLIGAYPSLFVFAHNRGQLEWADLPVPLVAGVGLATGVWAVRFGFARNARLAATLAVPWLIALLGYGLCATRLPHSLAESLAARLGLALALLGFAGVADYALGRRLRGNPLAQARVGAVLGVVSLCLIALPALQIGIAAWNAPPDMAGRAEATPPPLAEPHSTEEPLPDIYFIVLDGFGSQAVLQRTYDFDLAPFVQALEALGFVVPAQSRAHYPRTVHSLASTLNLGYLSPAAGQLAEQAHGLGPLVHGIRDNKLFRVLSHAGYTTYSFESGYAASELRSVDHYLADAGLPSEFARRVLDWTPIPPILEALGYGPFAAHRARIRFVLDRLPQLAEAPGPKLVFAHLLAPHPPFVFDRQGADLRQEHSFELYDGNHYLGRASRSDYVNGYRGQVEFISGEIQRAIEAILAASSTQPLIVVQGDHGPGLGFDHDRLERTDLVERMSILNAILVPNPSLRRAISDKSTPINTWRLILADLFSDSPDAQAYAPLPDRSFYTREARPYEFIDITQQLGAAAELPRP
jgi:hypothetical protein